ncbi:MAG: hypothetical protein WBP90_14005 [Terracidiphilus sp.]
MEIRPSEEGKAMSPAVKTRRNVRLLNPQLSISAGVAAKRLEVVKDVVMMVSNDTTAILCQAC